MLQLLQESDDTNEFSQELLSEIFSDSDSPSDQDHSTEAGSHTIATQGYSTGSQSCSRGTQGLVQPSGQKHVFKSGMKYILDMNPYARKSVFSSITAYTGCPKKKFAVPSPYNFNK